MGTLKRISVADAKRNFSEILGRVSYGREVVEITRRGRPVARIVPVPERGESHFKKWRGWLEEDDPFFRIMDEIVETRRTHTPRVLRKK